MTCCVSAARRPGGLPRRPPPSPPDLPRRAARQRAGRRPPASQHDPARADPPLQQRAPARRVPPCLTGRPAAPASPLPPVRTLCIPRLPPSPSLRRPPMPLCGIPGPGAGPGAGAGAGPGAWPTRPPGGGAGEAGAVGGHEAHGSRALPAPIPPPSVQAPIISHEGIDPQIKSAEHSLPSSPPLCPLALWRVVTCTSRSYDPLFGR